MPPKPAARKVAQGARNASTNTGQRTAANRVRPGATPSRKPAGVTQSGAGGTRQPCRGSGVKKQAAGKQGRELPTEKTGTCLGTKKVTGNCKGTVWKREDYMAQKIQTCYRGYQCRKLLLNLRKKRAEYDQMMEKLQREAYIQVVRLEQHRAEAERKREEEEKRKRREQARRITRMLEAAFDGDTSEIRSLMEELLLENGADPRLSADDGETPEQVAAHEAVENMLKEWKIEETERLLLQLQVMQKKRKEAENHTQKTMENKLQIEVDKAEKEYSAKQKELAKAYTELNKRIHEHDKNMATGAVKADITLATIHDAEELLESVRLAAKVAQERLSQAKLQLRSRRKELQNECNDDIEQDDVDHANVVINIRELDDVLMKDVGLKIAQSGRWPMIIDPSKQAATFLRYRDTNYLNCCNPRDMEPEVIRMALLGSIRYGKFLVLDLLDVEGLWSGVEQRMELVQKCLLTNIMNKSLITEDRYLSLIKQTDGEEYSPKMFSFVKVHNFKLVVLTQLSSLPKELMEHFYVIRIHVSRETL